MDGLYAENAGAIFCLTQNFITKKMVAYSLALWVLSQKACTALQLSVVAGHFLRVAPSSGILAEHWNLHFEVIRV